jgi:uncharacterized membrane protein YoaK (UPF0700 family)
VPQRLTFRLEDMAAVQYPMRPIGSAVRRLARVEPSSPMRADRGAPEGSGRAGDLLLVSLAVGAGVVDAISLTTLGVFTAAVTANIVFVGLAVGDADSHAAARAALALAGFAIGVLAAARALGRDAGAQRVPPVLAGIVAVQLAFLAGWLATDGRPDGATLDLLAGGSSVAMGAQTAAAGRWRPGITPTFVSGVLTFMLSELVTADGARSDVELRAGVIAAVAAGATVGAVLLTNAREAVAVVPAVVTALVALAAVVLRRRG